MADPAHPTPNPVRRLRWWFALAMAGTLLCSIVVAVVAIATTSARSSTDVADETVRRMGERTADLMRGHLDDAIETADAISVGLTADQLATRGFELDRTLAVEVETIPQISGVYLGFPDGEFRFVTRRERGLVLRRIDTVPIRIASEAPISADLTVGIAEPIQTDFDPRERPWYVAAVEADDSRWTDPYVFFSSQEPGVTVSQAIRDDRGDVLAVVGVDLSLNDLSRFLDDLPLVEEADAFITAGDEIVAAPTGYQLDTFDEDGQVHLATLDQLGIDTEEFRRLALGQAPVETDDGGRLHLIELTGDAPRWAVLIATERPEISASVARVADWSILAVLLTGAVLLALVPLATRALRRTIDELDRKARIDPLTSVLNRGAFLDAAEQAVAGSDRSGRGATIALIDLDDFKQINDDLGHPIGDKTLVGLGEVLVGTVGERDLVGRIGGDEFGILFLNADRSTVDGVLLGIQDRLARRELDADHPPTTVTIGVTSRIGRNIGLSELIAEADRALITAKRSQKGIVAWAPTAADHPTPLPH